MAQTRRETMAMLAGGVAASAVLFHPAAASAETPPVTPSVDAICTPLLVLLPEAAVRAGLPDSDAATRRCDDLSPDGSTALVLAMQAARTALPAGDARALLDRASATAAIPYGRNDPLASIHCPYRVSPYSGPHLDTPLAMRLIQPVDSAPALDAWLTKLDGYADALLGVARSLRADEAAGCVPPATLGRAALIQMDAFILVAADRHPLVQSLADRMSLEQRDAAMAKAAQILAKRVQPAMALVRDTLATLTRHGRIDPGIWAQPQGDQLHAANLARAGDTAMSPAEAQDYAREEVKRIAALLDNRLAARGLKQGTLAERIGGLFAAHPGLVASDDAAGRASLIEAAKSRLEAARAILPQMLPYGIGVSMPEVRPVPDAGRDTAGGSFYLPAGLDGVRAATLWLDTRSVFALPVPGVSSLACNLGLPGKHLLATLGSVDRPAILRMATWPAFTEGWACYAERLAADEGLFAHDPFGDIARLSDELLRAARLVVDVGIHAQKWTRAQAEAEMTTMTGAVWGGSIDRIMTMPGEAASWTLGLKHMLELHGDAKKSRNKSFNIKTFYATLLTNGAKPFAAISATA